MTPYLTLHGITAGFGGPSLFSELDLSLRPGDRLVLIGRNGSGKSTLLRIIAGELPPDGGTRRVMPEARVGFLPQMPDLSDWSTVRAYVESGVNPKRPMPSYRIDAVMDGLRLDGAADPTTQSGGEQRRVSLAKALVGDPEVLLLDEPTNHMDLPSIQWLEKTLRGFKGALVVISHDRAFLRRVGTGMVWLDRGRLHRRDEGFETFETWSEEVAAADANARARLDTKLAQEEHWLHRGVTARRSRNMGRLRRLYELRAERKTMRTRGAAKADLRSGETSGKIVAKARGLTKTFGDRTIVRGFDTTIMRGDRVGIIGPNGAGKTTLVRLLTGETEPDAGTVELGTKLSLAYLDQQRASIPDDQTLREVLCASGTDTVVVHGHPRHVAGYLKDFLFEPGDMHRQVRTLSGGERARLLFAHAFTRPSNLLILDEPTNDLDMETLDLLQELLNDYAGTLLLVSHDRDFLDRVVTSTIVMDGEGGVEEYAGGYSDYLDQRAEDDARPAPAVSDNRPKGKSKTKTKLSYKEHKEMDDLGETVAACEVEITGLEAKLADGDFYGRDPEGFQAAMDQLTAAHEALAKAEERWLELEILRDELEGS